MNGTQLTELEQRIRTDYSNIAGMVVRKDGKTVYDGCFGGCTPDSRIHVFSVTKSIVSILFGIALDKGFLDSIDRRVLDFYPEYTCKRGEKTIQQITIRDMLTMTAPYKYKSTPYTKYFTSPDWVKFSLDLLGGKGSIGEFRYAPLIGPDILSGILVKATGRSVLDFAQENLFAPLGIPIAQSVTFHSKEEQMAFYKATGMSVWVADPQGVNAGGWGLTLSAADLANIGQLLLNGGVWNGTQIVSENWIQESTCAQSWWLERNLPYGYLWWVLEEEHGFAAMGDVGNIIYVNRRSNLVVAITSRFQPRVTDRIELIRKYVAPVFAGNGIDIAEA